MQHDHRNTNTDRRIKLRINPDGPKSGDARIDFGVTAEVATEMPVVTLTPEPTIPLTPEPTATATEVPTPTEVVAPVPQATVEVDELGIRTEIPLGQGMTKEELKSGVNWFYDLSEYDLNQIIDGNLWCNEYYPNDSRPRDKFSEAILKDYEDLGWYHSRTVNFPSSIQEWNYFNAVYLGTTVDFGGEDHPSLYVSAFGTKDWLGNKFIVYANTGLYRLTDCGDFQTATRSNQTVKQGDVKPAFNPKEANFKLLNTNRGDVVNVVMLQYTKLNVTKEQMTGCGPLLVELEGADDIMNLIIEQREGLSTTSAKDLVDSSLDVKFNKLPSKLSLENFNNLVGVVYVTLPTH